MTTYDRTYEYRADFDGHEIAGHVVAQTLAGALTAIENQADAWGALTVDVRLVIEVKRTTCCQRGDWTGADHQPADAYLYVPIFSRFPKPHTYFSPETTEAYRWTCEYCGRTGTRAELAGEVR